MASIGLTGTIGSGKSLALEVLSELGGETIQADRVGHEVLKEPSVIEKVVILLGEEVLDENGRPDRSRVGRIVFADPDKRKSFEAIVHPALLEKLRNWLDRPRESVAVVEAALIPEWGIEGWFDEVWCLKCSDETALARWEGDVDRYWKIRKAQFAPERKQTKAERVIENERSQEELKRRIRDEWRRFRREHGC